MADDHSDRDYWRGVIDTQLGSLHASLIDIRAELKVVNQHVRELSEWRHELIGQATSRSAIVSVIVSIVVSVLAAIISWIRGR